MNYLTATAGALAVLFLVFWYNALSRQHELESLRDKIVEANNSLAATLADNQKLKDQVEALRPGMTAEQVRFALGTPSLQSVLHSDRWDYPYYYHNGNGDVELRKLTVFFDSDKKLVRWQGDEQPELQPFQIAKEDVAIVKSEDAHLKLDAERTGIDADIPTTPDVMPGVTLQQGMGESISDPSSLPGAPDDMPATLD